MCICIYTHIPQSCPLKEPRGADSLEAMSILSHQILVSTYHSLGKGLGLLGEITDTKHDTSKLQNELGRSCSERKQRCVQRMMGVKGHKDTDCQAGTNGNIKVSNESNSLIKTYWRQRDQKFSLIIN